jgi:hypothetical protein
MLRPQDIECLENHQRERTLQDIWFILHDALPLGFQQE